MNIFYNEHRNLLLSLIEYKVEFILVGGYIVNYYGYNRSTGDMDIWLKPDNENKIQLILALKNLNFEEVGLATIESWDFEKPQMFHIGNKNRPDRTDFMTFISGVKYDEANKNKIIVDIEGLNLPIIHYENLIQNKKSSGRLKDLADVEYLEKIILLKNIKK